jgi:outer membrane protein OmpA-like peptidoglycan-associated protein/tetratricopeptide (TPR) repeat protein
MKRIIFTWILLAPLFAFAQNLDFKKSNFPNDPEGFEKAYQNLLKGDEQFLNGPNAYEKALKFYMEAYRFNPNNSDLNYKIGTIYNALELKGDAATYFEKASELDPKYKIEGQKLTAEAYHLDMQWDKAIMEYQDYILLLNAELGVAKDKEKIINEIKTTEKRIFECKSGKALLKDTVKVMVFNLGRGVNTRYPEYTPVVTADDKQLFFTSRRSTTTGGGIPPGDVFYYEDIYFSTKSPTGSWQAARQAPGKVNTKDHDGVVSINGDGTKMIVCRPKSSTDSDLFESRYNGVEWSDAKPLEGVNTKYRETHAAYTPDGKTIYFVSNSPDYGAKGLDIFRSTYSEETKKWSKPENVGPEINTEYDEDGVFITPDGKTMYFSSTGHNSMGGYDIFKVEIINGKLSKPVNMGYPINTAANDVFFVADNEGKKAYFNSARKGGYGNKDLYSMSFLDDVKLILAVQIYDLESKSIIPNPKIELKENFGDKKVLQLIQDSTNDYTTLVNAFKYFKINVAADGYEDYEEVFEAKLLNPDSLFYKKNIFLNKSKDVALVGKVINVDDNTIVDAKITLVRDGADTKITGNSSQNGYNFKVKQNESYTATVNAIGFDAITEKIIIKVPAGSSEMRKDFYVSKGTGKGGIVIKGKVFDQETEQPVNAKIQILSEKGELITTLTSNKNTGYKGNLNLNTIYFAVINSDGYNPKEERFKLVLPEGSNEVEKNFYIVKPFSDNIISIKNIYFDFDKYNLKPEAVAELKNILKILNEYPNSKVELAAHCDSKGTYEYNVTLSINRAKAAYNWLFERGIAKDRMKYEYFSFLKPAAPNVNPDGSDNVTGRALNRRVEFKLYNMEKN